MPEAASTGVAATRRHAGRPPDPTATARILDAAWALFLQAGVEATAMGAVAARARVSKSTLYAAFGDRAALFEAAMLHAMLGIEAEQHLDNAALDAAPLRDRLDAFGSGLMSFLASEVGVAFYGPLSAEIRRRRDLSDSFWRLGPGRTRANLTALLTRAAARGEIVADEPGEAADLLFGLWQGFSNLELAVAGGAERVLADVAARVRRGTTAFLKLYAVRTGGA